MPIEWTRKIMFLRCPCPIGNHELDLELGSVPQFILKHTIRSLLLLHLSHCVYMFHADYRRTIDSKHASEWFAMCVISSLSPTPSYGWWPREKTSQHVMPYDHWVQPHVYGEDGEITLSSQTWLLQNSLSYVISQWMRATHMYMLSVKVEVFVWMESTNF